MTNNAYQSSRRASVIDRLLVHYARTNRRGFRYLLGALKDPRAPLMRARTVDGLLFQINPFNYIDQFILKFGFYEREVLNAIIANLSSDGVFWDIGSNIGLHAITTKYLRPDTQVICFEPSPFVFSELCCNAMENTVELITLNVGLSSESGYLPLSVKIDGNPGLSSFHPWADVMYDMQMMAWCDTGDNLVAQEVIRPPTVIKIDVEGFEDKVLSGMAKILAGESLRAVIFEAPPDSIQANKAIPVFRALSDEGFAVSPLQPTNLKEKVEPTNYLARRA